MLYLSFSSSSLRCCMDYQTTEHGLPTASSYGVAGGFGRHCTVSCTWRCWVQCMFCYKICPATSEQSTVLCAAYPFLLCFFFFLWFCFLKLSTPLYRSEIQGESVAKFAGNTWILLIFAADLWQKNMPRVDLVWACSLPQRHLKFVQFFLQIIPACSRNGLPTSILKRYCGRSWHVLF